MKQYLYYPQGLYLALRALHTDCALDSSRKCDCRYLRLASQPKTVGKAGATAEKSHDPQVRQEKEALSGARGET